MVSIPARFPPLPEDGVIAPGRPVAGRTFGLLCDGANALNGYRFLRDVHFQSVASRTALVDTFPSATVVTPIRMIWRTSAAAQRVWIGFWHAGVEADKTGTTSVTAGLCTYPAGALIGDVYSWTARSLHQVEKGVEVLANGLEGYASTGWGDGQPLALGANQGADVELRLSLVGARVYAVDVVEVYEGEL